MHSRAALLLSLLLSLLLGALAADKPSIKTKEFNDNPAGILYFDDSDVVLTVDPSTRTVWRSSDAGAEWKELDQGKGKVFSVLRTPTDKNVAIILSGDSEHFITSDTGKNWRKWESKGRPTLARAAISFHATDPKRMIYMTSQCDGFECEDTVYYTLDAFESEPRKLREDAVSCMWAKSNDLFTTGNDAEDDKTVLCVVKGPFNPLSNNYRLVTSNDFFANSGSEKEPVTNEGRPVSGILNVAPVKSYIVAAAKSQGTTELALYVTGDTKTWHRAQFGEHKLEEDAYTILESTNYSMQVDVLTTKPTNPMGVLLTSNSNGTFFTKNKEHTNRNIRGFVDFEKIQNIQGIVLVNTVDDWEEVERDPSIGRKLKSQISFDDGRSWTSLRVGDDKLHLHSVTEQRNIGRIFSSPAPGIVMGVGNTGDYLREWAEGDLYVSDDAGLTWRKAISEPHLYEFGDSGAILVAIEDGETDKIKWSLNHGKDWEKYELEDKIQPIALTTVPDSTTRKFILTATNGKGSDRKFLLFALDFNNLEQKQCGSSDFEDWYARVDEKGEPTCIMGHTQKFRRRKSDSKCFVGEKFKDPVPKAEPCKCRDEDFECDFENGFTYRDPQDGECKLTRPMQPPEGACKGNDKKFRGSSGYRKIPGNDCVGGKKLDEPVERECQELKKPVISGKISSTKTQFSGSSFVEYYYLERKDSSQKLDEVDETIIMRNDQRAVFVTHDHGKKWDLALSHEEEIIAVYPHRYISDNVYLITPSDKVYYSKDRAHTFNSFKAPAKPNQDHLQILSFHPTKDNWLIWTGANNDCDGTNCQTIAYVSTKGGDDWSKLLSSVRKCQFVYWEKRPGSEKLVYCEKYEGDNTANALSLLSSKNWFEDNDILKRDVINFATMSEFIVVAVRNQDANTLQVDTSVDGKVFADARFPPNLVVPHQQAYTVLDSSTHAVFLHVTVNNVEGSEYGSIIKSNSNGTSYVLMVNEVNRNREGYVDFEKMQGLEGVAVINRVANVDEAKGGMSKKLKTYMTHNDGADWALIKRPETKPKELSNDDWCTGDIQKCSLHLHGYTERKDPRDTFSSTSAVGLMLATGNVGEFLKPRKEANTFITRDAGVTWEFAAPGNWMWEYGDQGSIIVIVKEDVPTKTILYSLDEGMNWESYEFSSVDMVVSDITTIPSDASRSFMLWGKVEGDLTTVNLDFSGLDERSRLCKATPEIERGDKTDDLESDYVAWAPAHPNSPADKCLFGHVALYLRKKREANCYNGRDVQKELKIVKNCECTREDFECDYNYEKQSDGSCKLATGVKKPEALAQCKANPDQKEYNEITGYRKIPVDTCEGGKEMDLTPNTKPCPGYEEDYQKKHGMSGIGLFFAIVIPIAAAAAIGYWVWQNWEGKFGRIRLGDGGPTPLPTGGASYGALDRDAPWIKYPVIALSGVVAVVAAVPMLVGTIWSAVSTRIGRSRRGGAGVGRPYTSRSSFGRGGGGRYAVVPDDEGELLGEDSDEDI